MRLFTRLIPAFHSMSDGSRKIMFWVAFAFLALFSVLEMTLSIVREQIIEQQQETRPGGPAHHALSRARSHSRRSRRCRH
jgi:hypothetical protein